MNEEKEIVKWDSNTGGEYATVSPDPKLQTNGETELIEFKSSPEAQAAADAALGVIADRSFSGRNAGLGKMINCPFCHRRHRRTDVVYREHFDKEGNKSVTIETLNTECKQIFKQMWVEEDLETGELSIQYATVPLPGQKPSPKTIVGAKFFAKKRKTQRPNHTGLEVVEHTRKIFAHINPERFPEEASRMLEAKRIAINTVRNKRERKAKRIRQQQRASRRINRG